MGLFRDECVRWHARGRLPLNVRFPSNQELVTKGAFGTHSFTSPPQVQLHFAPRFSVLLVHVWLFQLPRHPSGLGSCSSLPAHVLTSSFFFLYFSNTKLLSFYTPFFLTRDCGCQGEINGRGDCFHIHMNVKVEEKRKIKYNIIFQNLSNWLDQPHHRQ